MPRIVSLIASATEIVDALGETDHLVGRSHECDYPDRVLSLPVCTRPRIPVDGNSHEIDQLVKQSARESLSIYEVFEDVLDSLQPTHIITQIHCEVCAVSLRDIELAMSRGMKSRPQIVSLQPNSLADIWADIRRVATALNIPARGDALIANLCARLPGPWPPAPGPPSVACIEWIEPLMAAGNWTPELIALAGAHDLFGKPGEHSPWMTFDQLAAADPDVIIVAPCGFDLARTEREMYWLTDRPEWPQLRAVRTGRVYLADGNQYFNRPGPRVVETFEILREMVHHSGFGEPECTTPRHRGTAWRAIMSM